MLARRVTQGLRMTEGGEEEGVGMYWDGWLWKGASSQFRSCQQYAVRAGVPSYPPLSWDAWTLSWFSPKWSWLEPSVWGGAWRISSLWVRFCLNYSFSFCITFAVSRGESPCPFSCLPGGMQDWCCPSAAALSSTFCVCLATCLAVVGRDSWHHMHTAVGLGGRCTQVGWPRWLGCECSCWERRM